MHISLPVLSLILPPEYDLYNKLYSLRANMCQREKSGGDFSPPRCQIVIIMLSTLITQSSRHSEECLLLQVIQNNSAHFESKAALFQLNFESAGGHEPATISSYLRIIMIRFYVSYTSFKSWCTQFVPISC